MKRFYSLVLTLFLCIACFGTSTLESGIEETDLREALSVLDNELSQRTNYISRRQHKIDSLISVTGVNPRLSVLEEIADVYTSFNNDSAIAYLDRALKIANPKEAMHLQWKRASLLPLSGFFEDGIKTFESIPVDSISTEELASYYDSGRQLYSYLASFYSQYPEYSETAAKQALKLQQELIKILPAGSVASNFNIGEFYFLTGKHGPAKILLEEIVESEAPASTYRARAAHHLSALAKNAGDYNGYLYYLAVSATADVMAATREILSLQDLGASLHDKGEVARSYKYFSTALENAVECGAALRMVDISRSLPIIEKSHSEHIASWRRMIYWIIAIMAVLLIVLAVLLVVLRHEMIKLQVLQNNLRSANRAKEIYISQFLQLCSIYMDKLNQFCKIATRKLAAGQADELYRMTKSGKFVEEQSQEFYEVFDNAFLHIYPNFVKDVNALLKPDCQIELKEGELLNTDLRILAFMRLGIEDSSRIAQVLNYSLNTIYAYRNRLKTRLINKETFMQELMKTGEI